MSALLSIENLHVGFGRDPTQAVDVVVDLLAVVAAKSDDELRSIQLSIGHVHCSFLRRRSAPR